MQEKYKPISKWSPRSGWLNCLCHIYIYNMVSYTMCRVVWYVWWQQMPIVCSLIISSEAEHQVSVVHYFKSSPILEKKWLCHAYSTMIVAFSSLHYVPHEMVSITYCEAEQTQPPVWILFYISTSTEPKIIDPMPMEAHLQCKPAGPQRIQQEPQCTQPAYYSK